MNIEQLSLAKKYAIAFLNIFKNNIDYKAYQSYENLYYFFKDNKEVMLVLECPAMISLEKITLLEKVFGYYHVHQELRKLLFLLEKQQRLSLLPIILLQIIKMYQQRNNIVSFVFYGSHELSELEKKQLSEFIAQKINKKIVYTAAIDKKLIAGIRLQSDTCVWEYSVEKKLKAINSSLYS